MKDLASFISPVFPLIAVAPIYVADSLNIYEAVAKVVGAGIFIVGLPYVIYYDKKCSNK